MPNLLEYFLLILDRVSPIFLGTNVLFDSLFVYSIYSATRQLLYTNIYSLGLMKISDNRERAVLINNEYPRHLISLDLTTLNANDITELPEWHWDYNISRNGTKLTYTKKIEKRKFLIL